MQLIPDPRQIPQNEMPFIVNCNQRDLVGKLIDWRTDRKGIHPFCHSMLVVDQGSFISQTPDGYLVIDMGKYMVPDTYLVFTELVNANQEFITAFSKSVNDKLNGPWWRKSYNWLQIVGQSIGLPWLAWPGIDDCTMDVIFHLKQAATTLPNLDRVVIQSIPNNCNPEQFAKIQFENQNVFNAKYCYDSNNGVIVPNV